MSETNGAGAPFPPEAAGPALQQRSMDDFALEVRRLLNVVVAGLAHTSYGIPAPVLMGLVARETGFVVGGSVIAHLGEQIKMRKLLKDAFAEGVQAAPMMMPKPDLAADTAIGKVHGV